MNDRDTTNRGWWKENHASAAGRSHHILTHLFDDHAVYSAAEVAAISKFKLDTVREWIRSGKLPATQPTKGYRVLGADANDFMNRRKLAAGAGK